MDSNEISVQGDLLKYLESEGYLQDLATTGAKYLQAILEMRSKGLLGPALCFRPEINLTKLKTMSVPLWRMCVEQPALAERLLQQLTMYILAEFLGGRQLFSEFDCEQIFTPLRLSLEADDLEKESLQKNSKQQLVLIKGVLSSYVSPSKYVRSCVTRCRNGECPGAQLKRRPGSWFKGRLCFYCKTEELEMPEERDVGEEVLVTILPLQGLDTAVGGKTSAIQIIFKDDLSAGLTIGSTIQVLCRPAMLQRAPNLTLEACSRVTTELSLSQTKMIPLTFHVEEFYSRYENSPWATVAALAMHFGRDMLPYGCLFNVRMNMILSLASQGSIRPLPLLVLGQENVLASRIMESAAKLSYRSLIHGCQNTISGVARKWEDNRENHCVEAGSLVLASEGVCLVGDWTGLKNEAKTEFKSAIEKGFATVKLPNKPLEFPMKASVWTHCSQLDKKMLKPVIDVFGLPAMADVSDEGNVNLANYILNKSQTHQEVCIEDYLTDTDLKLLISNLGTRKVTVTERAGNLIRNYFVASRRARVNGGSTIEQCLPIGAVQSMTTMAEAHARLSLRSEVLAEDALVAIALYEQSMVTLYGPAFQAPPPSYFDTSLSYENVQQSVDDYMTTVMAWAQNYIKSLIGIEE